MEFHISRALRDKLGLDDLLFSYTGNVVFADVSASRKLAQRWNEVRQAEGADPATAMHGAQLFAMGLIDELNHALIDRYRREIDPTVLTDAVRFLASTATEAEANKLLLTFTEKFPSVAVYRGQLTAREWLDQLTAPLPSFREAGGSASLPPHSAPPQVPNREAALEELLLLWLANQNPAFAPFRELFDDTSLQRETVYKAATTALPEYFATRPPIELPGSVTGTLLDALRAPFLAAPDSLTAQLDFIREKWTPYLGEDLKRVLLAIDVVREEDIAIWMRFHPPGPDWHRHGTPGRGHEDFEGDEYIGFRDYEDQFETLPDGTRRRIRSARYDFNYQAPLNEYEAFSADQAWMPNVVLMAKSTYVWLEQLSKKYGRHIHRLDHVPDEELRLLAQRGITGLWLIGLWERSIASRTIKHLRGHADAVASAYSLKEYNIAEDLGGTTAYEDLRDRAQRVGLRLASDMVPNHMGIDSPWVLDHPDWFVSRWDSPFPSYSFTGPDLSTVPGVEIRLDDHYYDQTDAAVAFQLRKHADNSTQYIFHGNDGTTFAWNDTAQLDYSKAYVREHVIQVILHVARQFPIIRFDAAMVLAKRHVQRLWFPLPGAGGSIPSRAENAMSQEEFDAIMPHEFWREVVDRVAVEVPGTLLLAEAFWMLEGYFVRTLGMHRVYNSAFMNMLRDEENAKYRSYLKKTIEFDPDILKRYVNFMSNPDERTTIDQFGSGDKCFGVATLMSTLPGLPMFGHGQIEGYTERYGMEYKQAKFEEWPNEHLVARHQREIAPLLHNRRIFAESTHFLLYDFWTSAGTVDENVFAYSNRATVGGNETSVILYNNSYSATSGTIHHAAASMDKGSGEMKTRSLADGLDLHNAADDTVIAYRDHARSLDYLARAGHFRSNGISFALQGYQYAVLLDWRIMVPTADYPWDQLCDALHGSGVANLEEALTQLRFQPVFEALRNVLSAHHLAPLTTLQQVQTVKLVPPVQDENRKHDVILGDLPRTLPDAPKGPVLGPSKEPAGPSTSLASPHRSAAGSAQSGPVPPETTAPPPTSVPSAFAVPAEAPAITAILGAADWFFTQAAEHLPHEAKTPGNTPLAVFRTQLTAALALPALAQDFSSVWPENIGDLFPGLASTDHPEAVLAPVVAYLLIRSLAAGVGTANGAAVATFDELHLRTTLADIFATLADDAQAERKWRDAARVRLLLAFTGKPLGAAFFAEPDARWLAGITESEGTTYLNKESFESLLGWMTLPQLLQSPVLPAVEAALQASFAKAADAGYRLDEYLASMKPEPVSLKKSRSSGPPGPVDK